MAGQILSDFAAAPAGWKVAILRYFRYFNPAGTHPSRLIGENPHRTPDNLIPTIAQVAMGKLCLLPIFGGDYPTHDGTGVRDYLMSWILRALISHHLKRFFYAAKFLP